MKAAAEIQKKMDDLEVFRKRTEILTGAKLREVEKINSAIAVQDSIRSKTGRWGGSKEIRKWREAR
ncbi:hypothetical protein HYU10_00175 [Candidatus Woesearchaeota archaeon]|nr:hypothetical protein [Candidatus Woesearchaeota archaeon]MBI2130166.1 hypothetical protein [Candidatus Woesearchaeota archaeon]